MVVSLDSLMECLTKEWTPQRTQLMDAEENECKQQFENILLGE